MIEKPVELLKKEGSKVSAEALNQTKGYILGALGLVAGLAWNDAIKAFIEKVFPAGGDSITAKFIYAILVTLAVVAFTMYFVRLVERKKEAEEDQKQK